MLKFCCCFYDILSALILRSSMGKVTKIFSVEADASTRKKRREMKNIFFSEVKNIMQIVYYINSISSVSFLHL